MRPRNSNSRLSPPPRPVVVPESVTERTRSPVR